MSNKNLQIVRHGALLGSLEAYISWVNQIPILTHEEEQALARRFHAHHDLGAARALLLPHLRFVVRIARDYLGYGLPLGDLIQEGTVGFIKAIKRFDADRGVRLGSFAMHWVKAEIHDFILRNWRIVKIATTKAQRKLFFNLRKMTQGARALTDACVKRLSGCLEVRSKDVRDMHGRLGAHDESFDGDADSEVYAPQQYLADHRYDPESCLEAEDWEAHRRERLKRGLSSLDPRSSDVIRRRWLVQPKATLQELASFYHISIERVRQIEQIALRKLKHLLH